VDAIAGLLANSLLELLLIYKQVVDLAPDDTFELGAMMKLLWPPIVSPYFTPSAIPENIGALSPLPTVTIAATPPPVSVDLAYRVTFQTGPIGVHLGVIRYAVWGRPYNEPEQGFSQPPL